MKVMPLAVVTLFDMTSLNKQILVIQVRVAATPFVSKVQMVLPHVVALTIPTLEILTRLVDQNAFLTLIVLQTKRVRIKNVLIPVLETVLSSQRVP